MLYKDNTGYFIQKVLPKLFIHFKVNLRNPKFEIDIIYEYLSFESNKYGISSLV